MELRLKVKLGDIADFANGINFDKSAYRPGVKIIGVSDFKDYTTPHIDALGEVSEDAVKSNAFLQCNDIVFVRSNGNKDLVGRCMIIPKTYAPLTYSGFCIRCRIKDTTANDPKFYLYLFKSPIFRKLLSNNSVGANIQNLSQARLARMELTVPNFEIQCKISDILSAYDNMIDNCKRQIALLEEAAQRLYREWFVDLRFPGHETTPVGEDGIPIDWKIVPITSIYDIHYGKTLATKYITETGKYPVYGSSKCIGYFDKKTVDDYKVLITSRGNAGRVHRTYHKESFVTNNSFVVDTQIDYSYIPFSYIFYSLIELDLTRIVNGSAQQQLTNSMLEHVEVTLPTKEVLIKFGELCNPYISLINELTGLVAMCNTARNELLPRLISGQIEIE